MLPKMQHHHHQMVQSPARLGLTTSNPSPPPTAATAPLLSSALLSLLPPLSRAQALLRHMASISSALFHTSPKHPFWLSSFRGSLPTFISTSAATSPSSTEDLLSAAASFQIQLSDAIAELDQILGANRSLDALQQQIRHRQASSLSFTEKLKNAQRLLDMLMDDYSQYRKSEALHDSTNFTLSDILSYAHRVSYTTFAPPDFAAHMAPLRGAMPPAPQEEQMRASRLFSVSGRDLGLPETERMEETLMEAPVMKEMAVPAAPSGWRPGMPVELHGDMSSVVVPPAGWRPGDPVSLPPQGEELLVVRRETEPIQVRHVQLDITLDQDEDSTDYSTDVGTSEEEEDDDT